MENKNEPSIGFLLGDPDIGSFNRTIISTPDCSKCVHRNAPSSRKTKICGECERKHNIDFRVKTSKQELGEVCVNIFEDK